MVYDKTRKRIQEVERALAAGEIAPEAAQAKIAHLRALGPKWVARYTDAHGREHTERAPSKREAEKIEQLRGAEVRLGAFTAPAMLRTKLRDVLAHYLENKMAGRRSLKEAKTHCARAAEALGDYRLEVLDRDADRILTAHFRDLPAAWSQKQRWNYKATLRAAAQFFISKKRLRILNPFDVLEVEKGLRRRTVVPTLEEYQAMLEWARARAADFPYLAFYLVASWETGLRRGEVLSWKWEGVSLEPAAGDLPWLQTLIEKQGKPEPVVKEIPMSPTLWQEFRRLPAGQRERGPVIPIPDSTLRHQVDMVREATGLKHIRMHDFRRAWKKRHIHLPAKLRMEAQGHATEAMDAYYLVLARKDLETIYRDDWDRTRDIFGTLEG